MKIALVTDTFTPQVNGVTTVLRRMVEAIRESEHEAAVVAPRYPGQESARANGVVRIASLPFPPYRDIRLSTSPYGAARRHLRQFEPDLIHVVTEGPLGLMGRRFALREGIPLVTSFHTDFPRYAEDYGVGILKPLVWRWLTWFHGPARLTQTPGVAVRERLHERGIDQAVLWGRGVDTQRFHPSRRRPEWRRAHGLKEGVPVVVHVGRLAREKNLEVLMDAWELARGRLGAGAEFLLVGDGPLAAELEGRAPWARRLGFLDRDELADVYANSDVCVLPSDTETYGLVALEAMASGVAVIAAAAGGFMDSVEPERNGLLVPPEAPETFAEAVVRLVQHEAERASLAEAGRRLAEERDIRIENLELLEQYQEAVDDRF